QRKPRRFRWHRRSPTRPCPHRRRASAERNANPPPVRRHLSVVAYEQSPVSILPSGALPVAGSPSSSREFRGRHTVSDDVDDLTVSLEGDEHLVPGFERGDLASQAPQLAEATAVSE